MSEANVLPVQGMKHSQSTLELFEDVKLETKHELHFHQHHAPTEDKIHEHGHKDSVEEEQNKKLSPRSSHAMTDLVDQVFDTEPSDSK
jgi:hypothetical protein